jgi:DNA polymerase III alpha subunit
MKTQLKDRVLWFDGTSEVSAELVPQLFLLGVHPEQIVVREKDEDLVQFDQLSDIPLATTKDKNGQFDLTWDVPSEYLGMDLISYLAKRIDALGFTTKSAYINRVNAELQEIRLRGLDNLFKSLIYVVDTFKKNGTVWGVGRGSSCASLVLFLMGLHKVDPILYNIPMQEFFHD